MARVNCSIPDELLARVALELPGVNVSGVLQAALVSKLGCGHHRLRCETCATRLERIEIAGEAIGVFYGEAQWRVAELVRKVGTAEGAMRVLKSVAEHFGIDATRTTPLVRPTRQERHAALAAKVSDLEPAAALRRRRRSA